MKITVIEPTVEGSKKKRVCAYARVSTESLKQGDSLENQIETYKRLITGNPDYEFAGVYADQGISGYKAERPEFQRMLADARRHAFDRVITKSISRFARNAVVFLTAVRELKALGIAVYFEEQHMDTLSEDGGLMLTVLASFAQAEAESMGRNVRWAYQRKFARGEVQCNAKRLLGYDMDEYGCMIINQKQAEVVREIYQLYLDGMGTFRIAKRLNDEQVPTITGSPWSAGTINNVLKNEKYKGDAILQKFVRTRLHHKERNIGQEQQYYVEDDHPAIIAPDDWKKVQAIMASRSKLDKGKHTNRYSMSGKLLCPHCGKPLYRHLAHKGKVEWWCSTYVTKGKSACNGIKVPDETIPDISEPTVVEEVNKDGEKHYRYTGKRAFDAGIQTEKCKTQITDGGVLPRIHRSRRTAIKL